MEPVVLIKKDREWRLRIEDDVRVVTEWGARGGAMQRRDVDIVPKAGRSLQEQALVEAASRITAKRNEGYVDAGPLDNEEAPQPTRHPSASTDGPKRNRKRARVDAGPSAAACTAPVPASRLSSLPQGRYAVQVASGPRVIVPQGAPHLPQGMHLEAVKRCDAVTFDELRRNAQLVVAGEPGPVGSDLVAVDVGGGGPEVPLERRIELVQQAAGALGMDAAVSTIVPDLEGVSKWWHQHPGAGVTARHVSGTVYVVTGSLPVRPFVVDSWADGVATLRGGLGGEAFDVSAPTEVPPGAQVAVSFFGLDASGLPVDPRLIGQSNCAFCA